jgi:polar amino acid transport system substrate-binding protein
MNPFLFRYSTLLAVLILSVRVALTPIAAEARTLAQIKSNGAISQCANPDALPYASNKPDKPGFQIEIGRAIAQGLGVVLQPAWVVSRMRASLVNCDIILDTIALPEVLEGPYKVSHPYQQSGVALGLAPGKGDGVTRFEDLQRGQRIGVMVGSLASAVLGKKGLSVVPYSFESDMLDDLAKGELYAAAISPAMVAYYKHTHPESKLGLVHAYDSEPELKWNVAVGMRLADDALVGAVNQVLDHLIADGTIKAIYAKYGVEYRPPMD